MMTVETLAIIEGIALIVAVVGTLLLYRLPNPECLCAHCSYHARERAEKAKTSSELSHDYAHKGGGFRDGDPDRYHCSNASCPRNPTSKDQSR